MLRSLPLLAAMASPPNFDIHIPERSWQIIDSCTFNNKMLDAPECDYQQAFFRYGGSAWRECGIKRKGKTTWRELGDKPSFKIKADKTFTFGTFSCNAPGAFCTGHNPASFASNVNSWNSKKVTLNNMYSGTGGADAYRVFRELGVVSPLSHWVTVSLYRAHVLHCRKVYNMVETINDSVFMKKYFANDFVLVELENNVQEKRTGGKYKSYDSAKITAIAAAAPALTLQQVNQSALARYATGEELSGHWDGFCRRPNYTNNVYVAYVNDVYYYIPHGTDRAFSRCETCDTRPAQAVLNVVPKAVYKPYCPPRDNCPPMKECKSNALCAAEYTSVKRRAAPHRAVDKCPTWKTYLIFSAVLVSSLAVIVIIAVHVKK
jgi:hypothetical protein